jgi:FMN phosphatase YigB (HAD superfamily)
MPIRAVIFDGGGVLVRTTDFSRQRWWEQQLGLAEGSFGAVLWNNPVSLAANVGKASEDEVWTAYQRQFALSDDDVAQLQRDFFAGGEWDERLLGYIRSLKSHYKTGLISNAWPHARKAVQQHVNNTVFGCDRVLG